MIKPGYPGMMATTPQFQEPMQLNNLSADQPLSSTNAAYATSMFEMQLANSMESALCTESRSRSFKIIRQHLTINQWIQ